MTIKKLLLAASVLAGASAFAQATLGTVTNVEGVVTATQGATGMTVTPGMVVRNGTRFVTTSNGAVTLRLNSGCTVTVPAGHGVTVNQSMTCQQLAAAVQPVVPVAATLPTPTVASPAVVNGFIGAGAALIAVGAIRVIDNDPPLSGR